MGFFKGYRCSFFRMQLWVTSHLSSLFFKAPSHLSSPLPLQSRWEKSATCSSQIGQLPKPLDILMCWRLLQITVMTDIRVSNTACRQISHAEILNAAEALLSNVHTFSKTWFLISMSNMLERWNAKWNYCNIFHNWEMQL